MSKKPGPPREPHGNSMIAIECMNAEELCGDETWWQIYKDSFPASQRVEGLVRAIYLDKYEGINGIDRGMLERLLDAS